MKRYDARLRGERSGLQSRPIKSLSPRSDLSEGDAWANFILHMIYAVMLTRCCIKQGHFTSVDEVSFLCIVGFRMMLPRYIVPQQSMSLAKPLFERAPSQDRNTYDPANQAVINSLCPAAITRCNCELIIIEYCRTRKARKLPTRPSGRSVALISK